MRIFLENSTEQQPLLLVPFPPPPNISHATSAFRFSYFEFGIHVQRGSMLLVHEIEPKLIIYLRSVDEFQVSTQLKQGFIFFELFFVLRGPRNPDIRPKKLNKYGKHAAFSVRFRKCMYQQHKTTKTHSLNPQFKKAAQQHERGIRSIMNKAFTSHRRRADVLDQTTAIPASRQPPTIPPTPIAISPPIEIDQPSTLPSPYTPHRARSSFQARPSKPKTAPFSFPYSLYQPP